MPNQKFEATPFTVICSNCKSDHLPDLQSNNQQASVSGAKPPLADATRPSNRQLMQELDEAVFDTLRKMVNSDKCNAKYLELTLKYLALKGLTGDQAMDKRQREAEDKEQLSELDLPFGND
jgi:hypothetical protein